MNREANQIKIIDFGLARRYMHVFSLIINELETMKRVLHPFNDVLDTSLSSTVLRTNLFLLTRDIF